MYNTQVKIHFVPQTCRLSSVGLGLGRLLARRQGADDGANFEEQVVGGLSSLLDFVHREFLSSHTLWSSIRRSTARGVKCETVELCAAKLWGSRVIWRPPEKCSEVSPIRKCVSNVTYIRNKLFDIWKVFYV